MGRIVLDSGMAILVHGVLQGATEPHGNGFLESIGTRNA